jgi:hypothetical protein
MLKDTESKPALVFIPTGHYNTISNQVIFSDYMEQYGFDEYKMKREYSFDKVMIILRKYDFKDVVFFSFDDIAPSYMTKRILLTIALKQEINLREINSGLCLYNDGEIDINTIYFFLRGNFPTNSTTRNGFKKILSKFL